MVLSQRGVDRRAVAHVGGEPERADLGRGRRARLGVLLPDGHRGTEGGEAGGDAATDPGARAGDDGDPPVEQDVRRFDRHGPNCKSVARRRVYKNLQKCYAGRPGPELDPHPPRRQLMDEITQKVVDGTAWREFCDLLADAGEVDPGRRQPRRPARSGRGLPHAHPAAARRPRVAARVRAADASRADLHLPRDDQDRRREPGQPLPRRVARRAVRLPDLGHEGRGEVDQLQPVLRRRLRRRRTGDGRHAARGADAHRARRHVRGDHLPAGAPRELAALRGRHAVAGHPPDLPRQAQPGARRAPHRAHRRRRARRPIPSARSTSTSRCSTPATT